MTDRVPRYRVLDHTGDFSFEVEGADLPDLLAACVLAASDVMFGLATLRPVEIVRVRVDPDDPEMAIFGLLSEVVFLVDARGLIPGEVQIGRVPGDGLDVALGCDRLDPARHRARVAFKAATLHGLHVERTPAGLRARVVMDT